MIYTLTFLFFLNILQLIAIIVLYADRMIYIYAKGDEFTMLNDKVYNVLKWISMLCLPALAVLIKTVFAVWSIPYGEEISTTVMAVDAFLGAILGVSHIQYKNNMEDNV